MADVVAMQAITHPQDSDSRGHELLERLVPLHSEEVSSAIGSMAGTETLARNVVPVLGLFTSGVTSYRLTSRIGDASLRYARARRALGDVISSARSKMARTLAGGNFTAISSA